MKTTFDETKTYALLSAVFIITIMMLGSQLMPHQALSQGQAINNTASSSSNTSSAQSNLSSSSVSIPLSKGYVNGKIAYFIATDASDSQIAASITNTTGFKVNYAPNLESTSDSALQQGYVFVNGIKESESPMGFQLGVATALPGKGYSPLSQVNFVKWNTNATPRILKSAAEIMTAQKNGELSVAKTNIVINSPAVPLVNISGK